MHELLPEDRPSDEDIASDDRFNKWLEFYERKMMMQMNERRAQKVKSKTH